MIRISFRQLMLAGFVWLALPVVLTVIFWFRAIYSIPTLILLIAGLYGIFRNRGEEYREIADSSLRSSLLQPLEINTGVILGLLILLVWLIFTGHAGYAPSERWDNAYRNAVLETLADHSWPVFDYSFRPNAYLSYYMAYWTPAAGVAKLVGDIRAGYAAMFLYSYSGLALTLLMLMQWAKKKPVLVTLVLLLFSFGELFATVFFQFPVAGYLSATGFEFIGAPAASYICVYIFNQGIPGWLAMIMMYRMRYRPGILLLIFSFLFAMAPFVALGIAPILGIWLLRRWRESISTANIAGLMICLLFSVFFMGNTQGSEGMHFIWEDLTPTFILTRYLGWLILDIGIPVIFIWKYVKKNPVFWGLLVSVTLFSLLCPAYGNFDFGWKVPISLIFFILCMLCVETARIDWRRFTARNVCFALLLLYGFSGNYFFFLERRDCYRRVYSEGSDALCRPHYIKPILFNPDENECYDSFVTDKETIWLKYFCPDYNLESRGYEVISL